MCRADSTSAAVKIFRAGSRFAHDCSSMKSSQAMSTPKHSADFRPNQPVPSSQPAPPPMFSGWLGTSNPSALTLPVGNANYVIALQPSTRTPNALAQLAVGWKVWLRFVVDIGALTASESETAWQSAIAGLTDVGKDQAELQRPEQPAVRFLELLGSAIDRGDSHVANIDGNAPHAAESWGWRLHIGSEYHQDEWRQLGSCVGGLEGDDL